MIITVKNESPFQILTGAFTIGPSPTGYELQVGATPESFTTLFSVGANTPRMVTNVANGSYYRLKNNTGDVQVNWSRTCVTEGGGGSFDPTVLEPYWTSAQTKDYVDGAVSGISVDLSDYYTSAQTEEAISAATSGKADAAVNPPRYESRIFPKWNAQGIITGITGNSIETVNFSINGRNYPRLKESGTENYQPIYAPVSAGTAGDILVSAGNGAPVWSAVTFPDVSNFVTSAQVETQIVAKNYASAEIELPIAAAVNDLKSNIEARLDQQYYKKKEVNDIVARKVEAGQVDAQIKDYVDPAIAEVNDTIADKELPVSAALNELNQKISEISGGSGSDMSAYYTSAQTEEAITSKNYVTSAQVETQITSKGYATVSQIPTVPTSNTAFTNDAGYITDAAIENLVTSAQVETQIVEKNYITSADTANFITSAATANMVQSTTIRNIVSISQAGYDALSTKDANTFYVITGTTA